MVTAEAKLLSKKYEEMMELLQGFREEVYVEWVQGAGKDCHFSLEQPLILRDLKSSLLSVNFSKEVGAAQAVPAMPPPNASQWGSARVFLTSLFSGHCVLQLMAVLREVKYLNFQEMDVPSSAETLFAQNEMFQKFLDNLDLITGWYNEAGHKGETTRLLFQCAEHWLG